MTSKRSLMQEIEELLDFDGDFLLKLTKKDLQILKQAIVKQRTAKDVQESSEETFAWGVVFTDCGEFKSSYGRSRGISMKVARGTTVQAFAVVYWRLQRMILLGLLGNDDYEDSTGSGQIELYDVTAYGIDGLPDSDPNFWCEMQVSGFGSGEFYWLPNLPPDAQVRASTAIQKAHSVGSSELDRFLPAFLSSWSVLKASSNPEHQRFHKVLAAIDGMIGHFYDIAYDTSTEIYRALEDMLEDVDVKMTQMNSSKSMAIPTQPAFLNDIFDNEEDATYFWEEVNRCLIGIQSSLVT